MNENIENVSVIFYDGYCGLCNSFVKFIIKYDRKEHFYFSALDSELSKKYLSTQSSDTVILLENGIEYVRSEAALLILKQLPLPISLLYIFKLIPKLLRDCIYKLVAKNRYRFFKTQQQCLIPSKKVKERFIN